MKVKFSPQVQFNESERIIYHFDDQIIQVTMADGKQDTFDFTELPDGELKLYDDETGEKTIETILTKNPIMSAKKENGVLHVELLNYIGPNATLEERFPMWIDHTDYVITVQEGGDDPNGENGMEVS